MDLPRVIETPPGALITTTTGQRAQPADRVFEEKLAMSHNTRLSARSPPRYSAWLPASHSTASTEEQADGLVDGKSPGRHLLPNFSGRRVLLPRFLASRAELGGTRNDPHKSKSGPPQR